MNFSLNGRGIQWIQRIQGSNSLVTEFSQNI